MIVSTGPSLNDANCLLTVTADRTHPSKTAPVNS